MRGLAILLCFGATPVTADAVMASRVLPVRTIITAADVVQTKAVAQGAVSELDEAIGREVLATLYPGRPIRAEQLGDPAIVERNQIVPLAVQLGSLSISTEGRALARGSAGEVIRVMNLQSRLTVSGRVQEDGSIRVTP